jgi:hypothetical protein
MIASPAKFDHVSEHNICRLIDVLYALFYRPDRPWPPLPAP